MKKGIEWLIITTGVLFLIILFIDFTHITKGTLFFVWSLWSWIIAITYAIKTRQEVDCRCFEEKEAEE